MYNILKIKHNSNKQLEEELNLLRLKNIKVLQILDTITNIDYSYTTNILTDGNKLNKPLRDFNNYKDILEDMSDMQIEHLNNLLDIGIRPDGGYCGNLSFNTVIKMIMKNINIFE